MLQANKYKKCTFRLWLNIIVDDKIQTLFTNYIKKYCLGITTIYIVYTSYV